MDFSDMDLPKNFIVPFKVVVHKSVYMMQLKLTVFEN